MTEPRLHLVIPTHTTRHLATCLAGLAMQTSPPDTVTLTCDTDDPAIARAAQDIWTPIVRTLLDLGRQSPVFRHVCRPHTGVARLNQVRNNGVRALDAAGELRDRDTIVVLDGDTVLGPRSCGEHRTLGGQLGHDLVVPYRFNLDQDTTERITPQSLLTLAGQLGEPDDRDWGVRPPLAIPEDAHAQLRVRQKRYERQMWLRRWCAVLVKPHKPKVLGGHHGVSVRVFRAVNGYDERFTGYGYDDDDLSRRVLALSPPPRVTIAMHILAFHLWHPTRAPSRPTDAPGYATFCEPWRARCERGLENPTDQPAVSVRLISGP